MKKAQPARNSGYAKDKRSKAQEIQKQLAKELMLRFDAANRAGTQREHSFAVAEPKSAALDNQSVEYLVEQPEYQKTTHLVKSAAVDIAVQTEQCAAEEFGYQADFCAKIMTGTRECQTDLPADNTNSELKTQQLSFQASLEALKNEKSALYDALEHLYEQVYYLDRQRTLSTEQIETLNTKCFELQRQHDQDACTIAQLQGLTNSQFEELRALRIQTNRGLESANNDLNSIYNMLSDTQTKHSAELQQARTVAQNCLIENEQLMQKVARGADMIYAQTGELKTLRAALEGKYQMLSRVSARLAYFCLNLGCSFDYFSFALLKQVEQKWAAHCYENAKLKHLRSEAEFYLKERQYQLAESRQQGQSLRNTVLEQQQQIYLLTYQKQAVQADNAMQQKIFSQTQEELQITRKQNETLQAFADQAKKEMQALREKQKSKATDLNAIDAKAASELAQCKAELDAKMLVIAQLEQQNLNLRQKVAESTFPVAVKALPNQRSIATQTAVVTEDDSRNTAIDSLTARIQQCTSELAAERNLSESLRQTIAGYVSESRQLCYQFGEFFGVFSSQEALLSFLKTQSVSFVYMCEEAKAAKQKLLDYEQRASSYKQALESHEAAKTAQTQQNEERDKGFAALRRENGELKGQLIAFEGLSAAFALKDQQMTELKVYLVSAYAEVGKLNAAAQIFDFKTEALNETIKTLKAQLASYSNEYANRTEVPSTQNNERALQLQDATQFDVFDALAKAYDKLEAALAAYAHGTAQIHALSQRLDEERAKNAEVRANYEEISGKYYKMLFQMAETGKQLNSTQQLLAHEENYKRLDAASWSAEFERKGFAVKQQEAEIASLKRKLEYHESTLYTYQDTIRRLSARIDSSLQQIAAFETREQQLQQQLADARTYVKLKETLAFYIYQQYNEKEHCLQISEQRIVELQKTIELIANQKLKLEQEQKGLFEQVAQLKTELLYAESQLVSLKRISEAKETEISNISYYEKHVADLLGKLKALTLENDRLNRMLQ